MSEKTLSLVASIRERLRVTIRRTMLADLTFGGVVLLGILAGVWVVLAAVEAGLWLESTPRAFLFWSAATVLLGLFAYFLLLPALRLAGILRGPTEEDVAVRIGERYPEVSDRLVNLLHLTEGRRSDAPDSLVDGAVRMLGEQVHPVSFEKVEDFGRARRAGRMAAIPVAALLFFFLAAPSTFLDASRRLLTPDVHYQRPAPFQLVVEPGSVELAKGAGLEIVVRAAGQATPRSVTLALNNAGEESVETLTLKPDSTGAFRHTLANVRRSIRYRASAEPVRTEWYDATVTERPLVRGLQLSLAFPAYTRIPPQRLEPNRGDVSALPGTRVTVAVGLGGSDVEEALLRFEGGRVDTLSIDGPTATGTFALRQEGSYQIVLRNASGLRNDAPITYTLDLLADAHPSIVFLNPEADAALTDERRAGLHVRMNDDYGFSRLQLAYRLAESRFGAPSETFSTLPLPLDAPSELDQEVVYDWLLSESTDLDPVPGDVIEYYVQVWDNDAVAGYKPARTSTQRLLLPSLAEQYERVEQQHDASEEQLEEMLHETTGIREEFRELRDALRRKQDADWEDRRQLEGLQERQEALDRKVEELSRQVESMTEEMEQNNLLSPETLEKYRELQKVVEEIQSPELQDALRKLQEAMEELNLQGMQQSIEQFEFSEQQYRERLERTLELFQKLRAEQELDQAARMAEEIARQQKRLEEQTEELMGRDPEHARDDEKQQGEKQEGENQQGEKQQGEKQQGEKQQGENQQGENQQGEKQQGEQERAEELAREQERSRQEMEALQQQLQKLQQQMEQMRSAPTEEMRKLNQELERKQLPQKMQENSEQLRRQRLDEAQQGQQQMQQQMQALQQQLQQMQSQMQGQQMQVNMAGLRRALSDILTLSQEQERLRASIRSNASGDASLREQAQQQVELSENLSTVIDSLQTLSRKIPQMNVEVQRHAGDALRAMGRATEMMTERAANETTGHQKSSMMHLNELALLLSDLLEQLRNMQNGSQSGSSMEQMLQQMQQMSEQQQQLNEQMQQFLNDVQGDRLSQDMQQRLQQMQAQQDAIRRQLKAMSRNPEARGKLLGDLNKIAEQMEETIEEMRRRQVDRRTVERQQQILSRLLDAQRSMQERGREKKREGREGEDRLRSSPGELPPAEEADKLRRDLIRALESGYAPDYEELIKRYFDLLQKQSQETPEP